MNKVRRQLKQIAHHLQPVVTVGDRGLSDTLLAEVQRALTDHELIKVKMRAGDREERIEICNELAGQCEAEIIQKIGKVVVLYKPNPDANSRLSNLTHR